MTSPVTLSVKVGFPLIDATNEQKQKQKQKEKQNFIFFTFWQ
jgi:hypothetical protein